MINQHNFDWSVTNKPLVIFIPNFLRGSYIRKTLEQFDTRLDTKHYSIVIANDGIHEDFEDLSPWNIYYFTLERENQNPRNGAFIRNYFIKRCKSNLLFQKDPETIINPYKSNIEYDWIYSYINSDTQNKLYRPYWTVEQKESLQWNEVQKCCPEIPYRIHWGFGTKNEYLKNIRGYFEGFNKYGWEDSCLYQKLIQSGLELDYDFNLIAKHLWHPISETVYDEEVEMRNVFYNLNHDKIILNDENWGNG